MKKLIILTDEDSMFMISMADLKNFTSMDINKINAYFLARDYSVEVYKFSEFDLDKDYLGAYILYQTSESQGSFYKNYIDDMVYSLEKHGAIVMPKHELLKAHHNKVYMEMMRSRFTDNSLKTLKSRCYGSWVDARNYDYGFPVVIKQSAGAGSSGVYLARNRKEYVRHIEKAGKVIIAKGLRDFFIYYIKNAVKKLVKYFFPSKSIYVQYDTTPVSRSIVVQPFIEGLPGDCKILVFGRKYYARYRKNRENDFRASGSGISHDVPEEDYEGLLNFAKTLAGEINFPIIGMDVGFDGKEYHLFEFQVIHLGTYPLHYSKFWHEFHDGKWIRYEGESNLEEEFSRAIDDYISVTYHQIKEKADKHDPGSVK